MLVFSQILIPSGITRKFTLRALLPVCFSLLVGCANLDDIAELSKFADRAQQTLPAVVADIPASCHRQNLLIDYTPAAERPASLSVQDCEPFQEVADHLAKDQGILIAYFDALGKLATNTPLSFGQTIDTNVGTIEKFQNLSKDAVAASSAAQEIAKVLGDAVTRSYRAKKVNSIVLQSDDAVQELTADLKRIIVLDYAGILSNESTVLDAYYQGPIAARGQNERLALIVVQRQYNGDTIALELRKTAAIGYGNVMDNLASLHAKLKLQATKKASLGEVAQQIGPDISNLKDAISKLQMEHK